MSPETSFAIAELADLTIDQLVARYEEVHQEKCRSRNRLEDCQWRRFDPPELPFASDAKANTLIREWGKQPPAQYDNLPPGHPGEDYPGMPDYPVVHPGDWGDDWPSYPRILDDWPPSYEDDE